MQKGRRKIKGKKPKKNHLCTSCSLKKKRKKKKTNIPLYLSNFSPQHTPPPPPETHLVISQQL
jgi:hypothetical protein